MQRMPDRESTARLEPLHTSQSFSRYDPSVAKKSPPHPVSILAENSNPLSQSPLSSSKSPEARIATSHGDIFDTHDDNESASAPDGTKDEVHAEGMEELPVEIQSLMERFLESLSLKSSNTTLSIDRLAELYQNFYVTVESHIATHIATLSSRIAREKSPTPSVSSVGSGTSSSRGGRRGTRDRPPPKRQESEQQMLTASEVEDRRKARRQLELKKIAMEEAVERGVCERVYPRLWRHTSTDDESRDAKLRSRAAALSVLGVDLKELLSTAMTSEGNTAPDLSAATTDNNKESVREKLAEARANVEQMNADRYPQAKLQRLSTVHKNIVESLSQLFPSSSSADEILPTLIYVLIISSPESVNVVSNLLFIQRFRNQNKLDGEAAYCLTNLEAAISFLETVDLSSIRRDEAPEGPSKPSGSNPSTPHNEASNPLYRGLPMSPPQPSSPSFSSQKHSRRLSHLLSSKPTNSLEAAGGAVLTSADSAFDAMHSALDGSFKFLFGRIREKQATQSPGGGPEVAAPKTLEDARKLVSQEETGELGDDEDVNGVVAPTPVVTDEGTERPREDGSSGRVLEMIGGKRPSARDASTASARSDGSGSSSKKVAFASGASDKAKAENGGGGPAPLAAHSTTAATASGPTPAPGYNAMEQVRHLSNSLNPLNYKGFSMRGFGRSGTPTSSPASNSATPTPAPPTAEAVAPAAATAVAAAAVAVVQSDGVRPNGDHHLAHSDDRSVVERSGVAPPIARFVEVKDARELNGFDVELLLRDYQRLAGAWKAVPS